MRFYGIFLVLGKECTFMPYATLLSSILLIGNPDSSKNILMQSMKTMRVAFILTEHILDFRSWLILSANRKPVFFFSIVGEKLFQYFRCFFCHFNTTFNTNSFIIYLLMCNPCIALTRLFRRNVCWHLINNKLHVNMTFFF